MHKKSIPLAANSWLAALLFVLLLGNAHAQNLNVIGLLLPDDAMASDARVVTWVEAARNEGLRMEIIRDTQFLQMDQSILSLRGIVLPDQIHTRASDALAAALRSYVARGGRAMLVFDFGALTETGFYPIPKSRFSDMAGVDYVLYEELRGRTTGLGPVTSLQSKLRQFQVPPGKSMPLVPKNMPMAFRSSEMGTGQMNPPSVVLQRAALDANQALYLPVSPADPGGARGFDVAQFSNLPTLARQKRSSLFAPAQQRDGALPEINFGAAVKAAKVDGVTPPANSLARQYSGGAANEDSLHAVSGYRMGALTYASYVTRGIFAGTQLAHSPDFGLVAGIHPFDQGEVLFVNLPLSYLAGHADGMFMQGFLHVFGVDMLGMPRLSAQPEGRGGLTLNWHLDSQEALQPMQDLKQLGVWNDGPYSINLTAGPDNIVIGDGLGFDLPRNAPARQFLREFDAAGHSVGSHGGWAHDYYGHNARETNEAEFKQYLVLNRDAVDGVIGRRTREYSAPEGNNPVWAMNWLEANGVVGAYYAGHTGLGPTRNYRDGVLRNPSMWVFPVTPFGMTAVFEEFQDPALGIQKRDVIDWYRAMVDFSIKNRTSRLIYMHPPGAAVWPDVVQDLLSYAGAKRQTGQFSWYTMTQLADFMTAREQVQWTETLAANGDALFEASHPAALSGMTWVLPSNVYLMPQLVSGSATIVADNGSWLVKANAGNTLRFTATRARSMNRVPDTSNPRG